MLSYLTAGESHGKCLIGILEGLPAGLKINNDLVNYQLKRRQAGYGRGERMRIESDRAEILSGIIRSRTIGSPVAVLIHNKAERIKDLPSFTNPRPGHADLAGGLKYDCRDLRHVLERASARETACRVAIGSIARQLLDEFNIDIESRVLSVGGRKSPKSIKAVIKKARQEGDTLGGIFEVTASGIVPGLGSHVHYQRRLDNRLAGSIMSIPSVKAVGFGMGFDLACQKGSKVHDEICYKKERGFYRNTNNAGGIEGGISNGEDIVVRAAVKPISTMRNALRSVDIISKKQSRARVERSDVCVVSSAGVIAEAVIAFELANFMIEKFGGDSLEEMRRNYHGYLKQIEKF